MARSSGSTRPPGAGMPATRSRPARIRMPGGSSPTGLRNPFRVTFRPGTNELWIGDVGLERLGGDRSAPLRRRTARRQLRLAVLRGPRPPAGLRRGQPVAVREPLRAAQRGHARRYFAYSHSGEVVPKTPARPAAARRRGWRSSSTRAALPARLRRRAVLRRLLARLHLGDEALGGDAAEPVEHQPFLHGAANPVDLEIGPGGDLFYVDIEGGAIRRIQYSAARTSADRRRRGDPDRAATRR